MLKLIRLVRGVFLCLVLLTLAITQATAQPPASSATSKMVFNEGQPVPLCGLEYKVSLGRWILGGTSVTFEDGDVVIGADSLLVRLAVKRKQKGAAGPRAFCLQDQDGRQYTQTRPELSMQTWCAAAAKAGDNAFVSQVAFTGVPFGKQYFVSFATKGNGEGSSLVALTPSGNLERPLPPPKPTPAVAAVQDPVVEPPPQQASQSYAGSAEWQARHSVPSAEVRAARERTLEKLLDAAQDGLQLPTVYDEHGVSHTDMAKDDEIQRERKARYDRIRQEMEEKWAREDAAGESATTPAPSTADRLPVAHALRYIDPDDPVVLERSRISGVSLAETRRAIVQLNKAYNLRPDTHRGPQSGEAAAAPQRPTEPGRESDQGKSGMTQANVGAEVKLLGGVSTNWGASPEQVAAQLGVPLRAGASGTSRLANLPNGAEVFLEFKGPGLSSVTLSTASKDAATAWWGDLVSQHGQELRTDILANGVVKIWNPPGTIIRHGATQMPNGMYWTLTFMSE
ncbi:MAG: hypothetical protein HY814_07070 [Candidatus Riflebacteria bacterium]|nr:hypothetical protein [Candidatus Riflebacteria bacterium]